MISDEFFKVDNRLKYPPIEEGGKYGYWTVIDATPEKVGRDHQYYVKCRCVCARKHYVRTCDLKSGRSKSCGCKIAQQGLRSVGKKFNRWTILEISEMREGHRYVKAVCDCGFKAEIRFHAIRSGESKSCGCYRNDINRKMRKGLKWARINGKAYPPWSTVWLAVNGALSDQSKSTTDRELSDVIRA